MYVYIRIYGSMDGLDWYVHAGCWFGPTFSSTTNAFGTQDDDTRSLSLSLSTIDDGIMNHSLPIQHQTTTTNLASSYRYSQSAASVGVLVPWVSTQLLLLLLRTLLQSTPHTWAPDSTFYSTSIPPVVDSIPVVSRCRIQER